LNTEGGVHLKALTKALYDSLKEFAPKPRTAAKTKSKRKSKSRKSDGPTFTVDDVCDGLIGLVNFKIAAPQFHSQVKDKLTDDRVHAIAYPQFLEAWTEFWSNNKTMAKTIVTRAIEIRSRTSNFLADKRMVKSVGAATKGLKGKLAGVLGKCPVDERELFIVEGDSAGGCLHYDTELLLADGTKRKIGELAEESALGVSHVGLCFDIEKGSAQAFTYDDPRVTKFTKELVELTFEDGTTILVTPCHPFLLTDGTYKPAGELTEDDELQVVSVSNQS
jgi:DNA gyrase subunit B